MAVLAWSRHERPNSYSGMYLLSSTESEIRIQVWVYIARVIVRLRDVPGVPKQLGCVSVTQIFRYVYIVVLFSLLPVRYNVHRCSVLSQKH